MRFPTTSPRRAVAQGVGVVRAGALLAGVRPRRRGALALVYHDVVEDPGDPTHPVSPAAFRSQLLDAQRWGLRFVDLATLTERFLEGADLDGLAAITFDDARVGVHRFACDILDDLGLSATVFVISDRLGEPAPSWSPGSGGIMTRQELQDVVDAGLAIESHTRTHAQLPRLGDRELDNELSASRRELEEISGRPVDLLAYPFGFHDRRVREAAARAGYRAAFSFSAGWITPGLDPLRLPRLSMPARRGRFRFAYSTVRSPSSFREHQVDAALPDR